MSDEFPKHYFETWCEETGDLNDPLHWYWNLRREDSDLILAKSGFGHDSLGSFDHWIKRIWEDFKEASEDIRSKDEGSEVADDAQCWFELECRDSEKDEWRWSFHGPFVRKEGITVALPPWFDSGEVRWASHKKCMEEIDIIKDYAANAEIRESGDI